MKGASRGLLLAATVSLGTLPASAQARATDTTAPHVRGTARETRAIIQAGMSGSPTFRGLVVELDASDVIVYVQPNLARRQLGGYLSHTIVASAGHRYLRVAIEIGGPPRSRVPVLAHELQHAVEVSRVREARDAGSLERLFERLAIPFGCPATSCFETQSAKDVEVLVAAEMAASRADAYWRTQRWESGRSRRCSASHWSLTDPSDDSLGV